MPRLLDLTDLDWGNWLYGLVAGFVGGGSSAVVSSIAITTVAPDVVMRGGFYKIVIAVFLFNGVKDTFLYLSKAPLPPVKVVETVRTVEKQAEPDKTTVTTVEKTTISPAESPKV